VGVFISQAVRAIKGRLTVTMISKEKQQGPSVMALVRLFSH
jgi:hypothetical protein